MHEFELPQPLRTKRGEICPVTGNLRSRSNFWIAAVVSGPTLPEDFTGPYPKSFKARCTRTTFEGGVGVAADVDAGCPPIRAAIASGFGFGIGGVSILTGSTRGRGIASSFCSAGAIFTADVVSTATGRGLMAKIGAGCGPGWRYSALMKIVPAATMATKIAIMSRG